MKILYLINVEWEWIFQRPQILELQLEKNYDICVVSKRTIGRKLATKSNVMPKKKITVWQLPKEHKFKFINKINKMIYRIAVSKAKKYDIIWVGDPLLFEYIPNDYVGKIIYDCMDDHVSMSDESKRNVVKFWEDKLIEHADVIFSSSQKLIDDKMKDKNAVLVRNGFVEQKIYDVSEVIKKEKYSIGYFGTVAEWFDFDLLNINIQTDTKINYYVIGPIVNSVKEKIQKLNSNICLKGVVEHSKLYSFIKDYDAMIMPFVINDIILAVDPVKLYEYICFGKCIISVWYPEIERFRPYVYFYQTQDEYISLIEELSKQGFPPKYNSNMQREFLKENSWDARYITIRKAIEELKKNI